MKNLKNLILIAMILAACLLTACGSSAQEATAESKSEPVEETTTELPEDSILYFNDDEGSAQLIKFFDDGNIPEEATFMYDQMGGNPAVTVTDPEKILKLYHLLGQVTVAGETDMSVTDSYHHVEFKLADNSYIHYSFEGSEIWYYEKQNYSIENSKGLFGYMKDLTEEYLEQEG